MRDELSINEDLDAFALGESFLVVVGLECREPDHLSAGTFHPVHPLNRIGVDAADGIVKHDASENLDAGNRFHDECCAVGGAGDVVLQYQSAHAGPLGRCGNFDIANTATEYVRSRMNMKVDRARNRTDFRWGWWKCRLRLCWRQTHHHHRHHGGGSYYTTFNLIFLPLMIPENFSGQSRSERRL